MAIHGWRPSIAETLTVTRRRTPASRIASSSAVVTSLMTVVGPRPSVPTIEMTASCPATARRMSSRFRPSPCTIAFSPRTPTSPSGRRVNAVIECPRRKPSLRTKRPVRPVDPMTTMLRFDFSRSDCAALNAFMGETTPRTDLGPRKASLSIRGVLEPPRHRQSVDAKDFHLLVALDEEWSREEAVRALRASDVAWVAWKVDGGLTVQVWPHDAKKGIATL